MLSKTIIIIVVTVTAIIVIGFYLVYNKITKQKVVVDRLESKINYILNPTKIKNEIKEVVTEDVKLQSCNLKPIEKCDKPLDKRVVFSKNVTEILPVTKNIPIIKEIKQKNLEKTEPDKGKK